MTITQQQTQKAIQNVDTMILACKAKGGYKFRSRFRCNDHKLDQLLGICEGQLRQMAVSLTVAETMLREPPPSIHSRWDEYQQRKGEAIKTVT